MFSENDIRPKDFEKGKQKAIDEDISRLKNLSSGFVTVNCPACESKKSHFAFKKYDFNFYKCDDCLTVYMNPRATPEILNEFYSNSKLYEYWDKFIFPASREIRKSEIFRPRVELINSLCNKYELNKNSIIDVGSASGMFLEEASKSNYFEKVIGIEPSAAQAETSRKLGIKVIESTLEKVEGYEAFGDIVVSFETIEHVSSPSDFLTSCSKIMKKNGLLILTCPNFFGFDILCLGEKSESLDIEHVNMFNPKSIQILLERNNFKILEISTPGKIDVDIIKSKFDNNEINFSNQPFLEHIFKYSDKKILENFQKYLSDNLLSSHMMISSIKL